MIVPIFSLNVGHKIKLKQICVGRFDNKNISLAGSTTSDKVFIHNSSSVRNDSALRSNVNLLNINQTISCLTSGILGRDCRHDILFVGTQTNLLAYDVYNNQDLFHKDVADGSNVIVIGRMGLMDDEMVVVGGNCSIQGFDYQGNDCFWTVTGDNVTSLALMDFDGDSKMELLVGSEDYDIRIFKKDEIFAEISENEVLNNIYALNDCTFAYSLINGTVGLYNRQDREWRIKSKHIPDVMTSFDVNGDGVDELITGWSNGKVDARDLKTGETIFKENLLHPISGIVKADYKQDGNELLMCCCADGSITAYSHDVTGDLSMRTTTTTINPSQELLQELNRKKTTLLLELKNYERSIQKKRQEHPSPSKSNKSTTSTIPQNTHTHPTHTHTHTHAPYTHTHTHTHAHTPDTIIRCAIVFAEGCFNGESYCIHPAAHQLSSHVTVPLYPPKDGTVQLYVKVFVGYRHCEQLHVFELERSLPCFSSYLQVGHVQLPTPRSSVHMTVNERINRICLWLNQNFLLQEDLTCQTSELRVQFISLKDSSPLIIYANDSGKLTIETDDIEVAGNIIQHLSTFLHLQHLPSTANFPLEIDSIQQAFLFIKEYENTKDKLTSDMLDSTNIILTLVLKAEDSRALHDTRSMKENYKALMNMNREMVGTFQRKKNNQHEIRNIMKNINVLIQKFSKLRCGRHKMEVVGGCREALKNNNLPLFIKICNVGSLS
ncbi:hypothetical protein HELRODRAFT_99764 [Helobdella robusta]|uniref:Bardet-Biedl syndrome 2 protein homolog n=1 Tax=Helobdella robusta TaxID=6412 RepID=T1G9V1_HELRO|nr:hypothetical protein HELRODRAFT_99764 [Helobdella robusta]ESO03961.1 hypothetical protein HELRODRAFT_99764 [Helobdella robusta]